MSARPPCLPLLPALCLTTVLLAGSGCENRVGGGRVLKSSGSNSLVDSGVFVPSGDGGSGGGSPESDAGFVTYPLTFGAIGNSCASGENKTYLILSESELDCVALGKILEDGPDDQAVAYAELVDLASTGERRIAMQVCFPGSPCQARAVDLDITEIGVGAALVGTWTMDLDGVRAEGNLDADWCNFDGNQADGALATGLSMTEFSVYQGVKVTLMEDGAAVSPNAPVIGGRPALVRLFVAPNAGFEARDIVARLRVETPGMDPIQLEETIRVSNASAEERPTSTFNIDIPESAMVLDATFQIGLYEVDTCAESNANPQGVLYPTSGVASLDPRPTSGPIRVIVVPVRYNADGSGRLPDTSQDQIALLRDTMYKMYPVPDVAITVREPLNWNSTIARNGAGWGSVLQAVQSLRSVDQPPDNTYYYGMFQPASSFSNFCRGGCVSGLGSVPGANGVNGRGSIGLGYSGEGAAETFIHEIGHNLGRQHAPCQVSSSDPGYPYQGGRLGVWGFDLLSRTLIEPNEHRDMMGYCNPIWISDYNFDAIFTRIATVNGARSLTSWPTQEFKVLFDDMDGVRWGDSVTLNTPRGDDLIPVRFLSAAGEVIEEAWVEQIRFDHLEGRYLLIPAPPEGASAVELEELGRVDF